MTLPEKEEVTMPKNQQQKVEKNVGTTLSKVLVRAKNDDRLVCGVFECAHHLEKNPDNAMVCILPAVAPNLISISIQHKLIEAYCLENSIQVLKVNCEQLNNLLNGPGKQQTENKMPVTSPSLDTSCVLVEWPPKVHTNKHENRLMDVIWHNQVIELPV